jgi:hypothetical protein
MATAGPTTKLGDDLTVSAIGFGAGALAAYGDADDAESLATLNRCLDLSITFIDTANVYGAGSNERLIARLLADRRGQVTLATKFGIAGNPADRAAGPADRSRRRRLRSSVHRRKPCGDRARHPPDLDPWGHGAPGAGVGSPAGPEPAHGPGGCRHAGEVCAP